MNQAGTRTTPPPSASRRAAAWLAVVVVCGLMLAPSEGVQGQMSPIATPGVTATPGATSTPTLASPLATPTPDVTATPTEGWIQPPGTGTPHPTAIELLMLTARSGRK